MEEANRVGDEKQIDVLSDEELAAVAAEQLPERELMTTLRPPGDPGDVGRFPDGGGEPEPQPGPEPAAEEKPGPQPMASERPEPL